MTRPHPSDGRPASWWARLPYTLVSPTARAPGTTSGAIGAAGVDGVNAMGSTHVLVHRGDAT